MTYSILFKGLRDKKVSTLSWAFALFVFAMLFAAMYKIVAGDLNTYIASFPDEFSAFLGDFSKATTTSGWLGIELYGLFVPLILAIVGASNGASTIGKEEDSGTLELLLASPISRSSIVTQKTATVLFILLFIALGPYFGAALGTLIFEFDVNLFNVFWASVSAWMLGVFFAMLSLAVQGVTGKTRLSFGVGSGVVAFTYALIVISKLVDSLESLKYISPFHYYNVDEILESGPNFTIMSVLIICAILLFSVALAVFSKRDTGV